MADRAVVLFAKEPVPGLVKSRLAATIGEQEAASLYECFLLDSVAMLSSLRGTDLLVAWDGSAPPTATTRGIASICPAAGLFQQKGAGLSERLENAFARASGEGYSRIAAVGSDSPTLPPHRVEAALDKLDEADFAIGPTFDGGYYLIASRTLAPGSLRGVAWSTDRALVETVRRLAGLGLTVCLLEPWYDVDDEAGLGFLRAHLEALAAAGGAVPCPRTFEKLRAACGRLGGGRG